MTSNTRWRESQTVIQISKDRLRRSQSTMLISFVEVDGHLFYCPLAEFSSSYAKERLEASLVVADPITAATPLRNAKDVAGKVVLVQRGACDFLTKTVHVQKAGGVAVVVANTDEENPQLAFVMDAGQSRAGLSAKIPAIMAPFATAQHLLDMTASEKVLRVAVVLLDAAEASAVLDNQERERRRRLEEADARQKQLERERKQREATMLLRSRLVKESKENVSRPSSPRMPPPPPAVIPPPPTVAVQSTAAPPLPKDTAAPSTTAAAASSTCMNIVSLVPSSHPPHTAEPMAQSKACAGDVLSDARTGLLVFDVQYYCAMPHVGKHANVDDLNEYYFDRIKRTIVPNIQSLLHALRQRSMEVLYATIESATKNGRDRSKAHKLAGVHVPKQSFDAKVLESVAPTEYDIVIPRTAISLFSTTNADYIFRNLGLDCLVVVGVSTLGSLETAVRDALDRGYAAIVVEDAIAFETSDEHAAVIKSAEKMGAYVVQTRDFLVEIQAKCPPRLAAIEAVSM
ncbi:Aste57867_21907 [Aphanomyces stellatus]|uniref:Aste57867_21907 protein n=1 Tax=Aphanomyces stellatus TaxID=120398 RepID=A0A485LK38_9STRA|nr:hypothetical protein As57867_021838 [Aphanomyces stellatus]VFT98575.1 Aste57867_21907 [Aphanomyces stellatus]